MTSDANEIVHTTVGGKRACWRIWPNAQFA